ncbi:hypothetical protein B5E84_09535 [Lachnoclostridium sp. An14]|uniref:peptidoglycan editing factor PgeF n=1 Tax=Lachnoclostridium sp. An14 TaxID=1965562 RepID=UPI000B38F478|nr:peptidoglycan editing factor PgeF [Lachnoclostridium sp. An14]OUQ17895.1 hypothetical protein B5E84_09535 [Lachnoclostridium sp. An14]
METIHWKKKDRPDSLKTVTREGVTYLAFPALEETGLVAHGFSTRLGGVSEGAFSTMNFSFTRGDDPERVRENYRRMAKALGVETESMTLTYQTHTVNVRRVTAADRGKGVVRERDYRDVDGLITDEPGITLVTFFADCVPLYFLDPVRRAIGLSHSGWRGTVARMGRVTAERMREEFGSQPEDLIACVGPSICQDCYEVGEEVAEAFRKEFDPRWHGDILAPGRQAGKYQLDLWRANEIILLEAGLRPEHLHVTNICTCCNPELLYSHRRMGERRGNLCAFLGLRDGMGERL